MVMMDFSRSIVALCYVYVGVFFFQAEDGIRYLVRSRGLGDVYKRQAGDRRHGRRAQDAARAAARTPGNRRRRPGRLHQRLSLIHILTLPPSDLV